MINAPTSPSWLRPKSTRLSAGTKMAIPKKVAAAKAIQPVKAAEATKTKVSGKGSPKGAALVKAKAAAKKKKKAPKPSKKTPPKLTIERDLWEQGHTVIVGLDEVGRGAWAGPLAIGAVVLPKDSRVNGVRDSKMLTEREREALFDKLTDWCTHWSVGMVDHDECDRIGMSAAQKLAAKRAIEGLGVTPDHVLIDGNWDFVAETVGHGKTTLIVKGDATCLSISTASVIAKVTRDRLLREMDEHFPGYNFAENKGYPCPKHKMALQAYGPSTFHRKSWAFMDYLVWSSERLVPEIPGQGHQQSLFD